MRGWQLTQMALWLRLDKLGQQPRVMYSLPDKGSEAAIETRRTLGGRKASEESSWC